MPLPITGNEPTAAKTAHTPVRGTSAGGGMQQVICATQPTPAGARCRIVWGSVFDVRRALSLQRLDAVPHGLQLRRRVTDPIDELTHDAQGRTAAE